MRHGVDSPRLREGVQAWAGLSWLLPPGGLSRRCCRGACRRTCRRHCRRCCRPHTWKPREGWIEALDPKEFFWCEFNLSIYTYLIYLSSRAVNYDMDNAKASHLFLVTPCVLQSGLRAALVPRLAPWPWPGNGPLLNILVALLLCSANVLFYYNERIHFHQL